MKKTAGIFFTLFTIMLIIEFILLILWILAYCGISRIPNSPDPMQLIAVITLIFCTSILRQVQKKRIKQ